MSDQCCDDVAGSGRPPVDPRFRRVLWIALAVNAAMFAVEVVGGLAAESVSLLADALDFLGDAANYGVSLFVLALAPLWRSRAAFVKGLTMGAYGLFVLGQTAWNALAGIVPEPVTMGAVASLALFANVSVAGLLYGFRTGDANMRSVWLCTRNDVMANLAVMAAALVVLGTGAGWPDFAVAAVIAGLALSAAAQVLRHARRELAGVGGEAFR